MLMRCLLAAALALALPAAAALADNGIPAGKYQCQYFGRPLPLMNFVIAGGGKYTDSAGKAGTYSFDAGQNKIAFHGGALDGQNAVFRAGHPPSIAILGARGDETENCQPAK